MTAEAAIVVLMKQVPVHSHVNGRIAQAGVPQGIARPNIIYQRINTNRRYSNDGPTKLPKATIQIGCWANSYPEANSLAKVVREKLDGFKGTVEGTNGQTIKIDAIFLSEEQDAPVPESPGVDTAIRGILFDAAIHYHE